MIGILGLNHKTAPVDIREQLAFNEDQIAQLCTDYRRSENDGEIVVLENLRFDITTLKGWFRNPATRILLVFFLSNLGSAIGTWVAGFKIFGALS